MARKINYTKNGNEYFRVTTSIGRDNNGKLIRKEFYGTGKADAEAKRDDYLNNIRNGLKINYKDIILGELMHLWLFEIVKNKVKPTSFERYDGIYRNYLKDGELYGIKIHELKSLQIQRYYNELFKDGKSSNSIRILNKLMITFLNYAVDEDYLLRNLCIGNKITIPGISKIVNTEINSDEIQVFSNDEIKDLKNSLEGHRLKCLVLLALGTGLRQSELLALKWDDIDFTNNELSVNKSVKRVKLIKSDGSFRHEIRIQTTKTKNSNRIVPIPSSLVVTLKEHAKIQKEEQLKLGSSYAKNNIVFATASGNYISTKNLFMSYKNLLIKAGIIHKKFHALRHTYATKLFERDVPLKTVQILLGHSDIYITANTYTHVIPREKITAVEKLNDLFI